MSHKCTTCNKEYSSYKSLWNHIKLKHTQLPANMSTVPTKHTPKPTNGNKHTCNFCDKTFSRQDCLKRHIDKRCKNKEKKENEMIEKIKTLEETQKNMEKKIEELEKAKPSNQVNEQQINIPLAGQLINMIMDKNKTILELKDKESTKIDEIKEQNTEIVKETGTLVLNNVIIISRLEDNYINATQLCNAGGKKFNDWFRLDTTSKLINELQSEAGIPASQLIDIKKGNSSDFNQGSWVHPDLAIQLAQWISSKFALQVSKWIRGLFTNGNVEINMKLLKDKDNELKLKDQKIQLLQDICMKKQQRKDYPEKNVVYILTTEDNKKKRIYIVGKAKELKTRLSPYNKTAEHEVVYYKECKDEEHMKLVEAIVLFKLKEYKEKANRDRFILPVDKDISFFTNIIENTINIL